MLHDLFTIEIIEKPQGGLNNFEHNCNPRSEFQITTDLCDFSVDFQVQTSIASHKFVGITKKTMLCVTKAIVTVTNGNCHLLNGTVSREDYVNGPFHTTFLKYYLETQRHNL